MAKLVLLWCPRHHSQPDRLPNPRHRVEIANSRSRKQNQKIQRTEQNNERQRSLLKEFTATFPSSCHFYQKPNSSQQPLSEPNPPSHLGEARLFIHRPELIPSTGTFPVKSQELPSSEQRRNELFFLVVISLLSVHFVQNNM